MFPSSWYRAPRRSVISSSASSTSRSSRSARRSAPTSTSSTTRSAASGASSSDSAERVGLRIAAAGTHPFSRWKDQVISPGERYENIVEELQQLARSLLIFGLHIHVAVPDRNSTIELLNEARYFLPHLLALSTSSPFWQGRDTGLKSYRTTVFRRFPRSGHPRSVRLVERVRGIPGDPRPAALHRQRQESLVGSAAASDVRHARVPHLRRADVSARDDRARRAGAGDRREALSAAQEESRASASTRARSSKKTSGARPAMGSTVD